MKNKKVVLIIMDGWGHGDGSRADVIANSNTPFIDSLYEKYPHAELLTSGRNVGLPDGQMGNSEVGHLNLGAGRIVYQDIAKINKAIEDKTMDTNPVLLDALKYAKDNKKEIHLIGLVSDGGVHSHIQHLKVLCEIAAANGCEKVFIHAFTDGRDTDPKSGLGFIKDLRQFLLESRKISGQGAVIASVIGRYYAMDRDRRWERVKVAYDMLVHGQGSLTNDIEQSVRESYRQGLTDEFLKPIIQGDGEGKPLATIKEGDVVLCFNFRTDRCREITQVLTQRDFPEHEMNKLNLYYVTMTNYDETFKNVQVMFHKDDLSLTLGEVLSLNDKKQMRIAETEKYPHVTFFFSGGREEPFKNEQRILIPSAKVATYDLKPSMSAYEVKDAIVAELKKGEADFVCLNFANPDMVGHTGVYSAIQEAVETTDKCVKEVVEAGLPNGYSFIITADHGNADYAVNPDGSPNTAHTKNPVPWFLIDKGFNGDIRNGVLADIAPTILAVMGIDIPPVMTGKVLLEGQG